MSKINGLATSRSCYVPSAVSSFFEICDRNPDGSEIEDISKVGARGGGFVIKRGTVTSASAGPSIKTDSVFINGKKVPKARTTLKVIELMRNRYELSPISVSHTIEPPIGLGFGTSGSGSLGASCAISSLFGLKMTLTQTAEFAHEAEIQSITGLGTVISLASGSGPVGLVTEPGSYSVGRVDTILVSESDYLLVCIYFGSVEKASIIHDEQKRHKVNEFGRSTLEAILRDPTSQRLLSESRIFAEKTGLASNRLLKLVDKAIEIGAVGATQNMIGNAIHCLVPKTKRRAFYKNLTRFVRTEQIFESGLIHSGPRFV